MRTISLLLFFQIFIFESPAFSQIITIHEGSPVQIDGHASTNEWTDADSVIIQLNLSSAVTVKFKHDGVNFNFAFLGNLESFNIRFPEILFDVQNNKSATWMSDDWWFHVSATDCVSNSGAGDYSNCLLVQPDWLAENNFVNGPPFTDTVEIQIPFSKINFLSQQTDTIGIAFDVSNTFSAWEYWPASGVNSQVPSTWGTAIVEFATSNVGERESEAKILLYPDPVFTELKLFVTGSKSQKAEISIVNVLGEEFILQDMIQDDFSERYHFNVSNLSEGFYILKYKVDNTIYSKRFLKLKNP